MQPSDPSHPFMVLAGKRVLFVNDHEALRAALTRRLERVPGLEHHAYASYEAAKAVEGDNAHQYDLFLLDVNMADGKRSNLAFAEELIRAGVNPHRIIFLSHESRNLETIPQNQRLHGDESMGRRVAGHWIVQRSPESLRLPDSWEEAKSNNSAALLARHILAAEAAEKGA